MIPNPLPHATPRHPDAGVTIQRDTSNVYEHARVNECVRNRTRPVPFGSTTHSRSHHLGFRLWIDGVEWVCKRSTSNGVSVLLRLDSKYIRVNPHFKKYYVHQSYNKCAYSNVYLNKFSMKKIFLFIYNKNSNILKDYSTYFQNKIIKKKFSIISQYIIENLISQLLLKFRLIFSMCSFHYTVKFPAVCLPNKH